MNEQVNFSFAPKPVAEAESVHIFSNSLAMSHAASDLPLWRECYIKAFSNFQTMCDHRQNGDHQLQGIDRSVILTNGKQILIDEKIRGRNKKTGKVYTDIALEEKSSIERDTPGWVVKQLLSDYIAYAIAPLGKCYLLPVLQLQEAWLRHGEAWKQTCPKILAPNKGYKTLSWGIPPDVLFKAVGGCLRIDFTPIQFEFDYA